MSSIDSNSDPKRDFQATVKSEQPLAGFQRRPWWKLGGKDPAYVSVDAGYANTSATSSELELDIPDKAHNVWESSETRDVYKPIEGYEGAHRFDPNFKWEPAEEKKLVRTLDWRVTLPCCLMFFALQLDRGNITQAIAGDMLTDLDLSTDQYNNGMTIFYCAFLLAELPSQLVSKKLGPDVWIPIQMVAWSIVAASQCALRPGVTGFYVTRAFLGLIEGGFIPDVILYLSYYFKNNELPRRLSYFWTAYQATSIVGALLGFGILHISTGSGLKTGWRYLFAIEGALTGLIGILTYLYLPPSPTQTKREGVKGFFRPKQGWFTEREEYILVTRVLLDDPGKASMHNRQGLSFRALYNALADYDLWPIYLLGITWSIPAAPPAAYITLTTKALGFTTFQTSLLTIPAYALFIVQLLVWTWISDKINQRVLIVLIAQLWWLPLLIALEVLPPVFPDSDWSKWAITTLIIGYPYPHAILVALTSRNSGTVRTRTVASSCYNMSVQMSTIFASQVYRTSDKPYYYRGNKILLGILAWSALVCVFTKWYYVRANAIRDKKWDALTREERIEYLRTTKDEGNKRLDFRFSS